MAFTQRGTWNEASDSTLVTGISRYDQDALAEVYRQHGGAMFGLAMRLLRDRTLAEEITQEVIATLHEEAQVIAIAYGADADGEALSRIASDGQVQVVGTQGTALRDFLAAVGETLSQTIQGQQ